MSDTTRLPSYLRRHLIITVCIAAVVCAGAWLGPGEMLAQLVVGAAATLFTVAYLPIVLLRRSGAPRTAPVFSTALIAAGVTLALAWSWFALGTACGWWPPISGLPEPGYDHALWAAAATAVPATCWARGVELAAYRDGTNTLAAWHELRATTAHRRVRSRTEEVQVTDVTAGDVVVVHPGELVPCDGTLISTEATLDATTLTGATKPLTLTAGADVPAGAWSESDDDFSIRVVNPVDTGLAASIRRLTYSSQPGAAGRRRAQAFAAALLPIVVLAAAVSGLLWVTAGKALDAAEVAAAVLLVVCPCALGSWTPLAVTRSARSAATRGITFRGPDALRRCPGLTDMIVPLTGVVTTGRLLVDDITCCPTWAHDDAEALRLAASLEDDITHPIADAIAARAQQVGVTIPAAEAVVAYEGLGLRGNVTGVRVQLGAPRWFEEFERSDHIRAAIAEVSANGSIVVALAVDKTIVAVIALSDEMRPGAKDLVKYWRKRKIDVHIISGAAPRAVAVWAERLGATSGRGNLAGTERVEFVRTMDETSDAATPVVGVMADPRADADALRAADFAVALGCVPDPADSPACDIAMLLPDLRAVPTAFDLRSATARIVRRNHTWALVYNAVAVALCAAAVVPAALAPVLMAMSATLVVRQSLRTAAA